MADPQTAEGADQGANAFNKGGVFMDRFARIERKTNETNIKLDFAWMVKGRHRLKQPFRL